MEFGSFGNFLCICRKVLYYVDKEATPEGGVARFETIVSLCDVNEDYFTGFICVCYDSKIWIHIPEVAYVPLSYRLNLIPQRN